MKSTIQKILLLLGALTFCHCGPLEAASPSSEAQGKGEPFQGRTRFRFRFKDDVMTAGDYRISIVGRPKDNYEEGSQAFHFVLPVSLCATLNRGRCVVEDDGKVFVLSLEADGRHTLIPAEPGVEALAAPRVTEPSKAHTGSAARIARSPEDSKMVIGAKTEVYFRYDRWVCGGFCSRLYDSQLYFSLHKDWRPTKHERGSFGIDLKGRHLTHIRNVRNGWAPTSARLWKSFGSDADGKTIWTQLDF
ncbi:MAG: hypothetical protein H6707_21070 [Deltaproteobacteria bacterium]|nr:hypothetical protein [Deltaproteobacteria bacterium]